MSDYYNEQQVERFEKEAYDAAMGEAGREADRAKAKYMEYAWNIEQENIQLKQRIAELEEQLLKVSKEYAEMSFARRVNKHNETIRDSRGEA